MEKILNFSALDKINEAKATYKEDPEAMKVLSILPDQVLFTFN